MSIFTRASSLLVPSRRRVGARPLCRRCGRPVRTRRRYAPRWPSRMATLNMAAGDLMYDATGNVVYDAAGNEMYSDGLGDTCCCGGTNDGQCACDNSACANTNLAFDCGACCPELAAFEGITLNHRTPTAYTVTITDVNLCGAPNNEWAPFGGFGGGHRYQIQSSTFAGVFHLPLLGHCDWPPFDAPASDYLDVLYRELGTDPYGPAPAFLRLRVNIVPGGHNDVLLYLADTSQVGVPGGAGVQLIGICQWEMSPLTCCSDPSASLSNRNGACGTGYLGSGGHATKEACGA